MLLVKPSAEILAVSLDALQLIEAAGRTCYKSEDKITDTSAPAFAAMILKRGHESVIEHATATVRFICDRGVTHEIVRHRIASYSQESTRCCDYGKMGIRFIIPGDFELNDADMALLKAIEDHYNHCLSIGRSPQQARYFLPNGLKTEIVMTANLREWRHFFKLRTSAAAHPQMREVAIPLLAAMKERIPVIFDGLVQEYL
jgi:thymidylate synthase (FAD)